jgi:hypothetical protein
MTVGVVFDMDLEKFYLDLCAPKRARDKLLCFCTASFEMGWDIPYPEPKYVYCFRKHRFESIHNS